MIVTLFTHYFAIEFIQNEQYPYNLNFNDSLTELSPEETEQFLEDAFSLSSKSPLSDDLTESSLSLQNSPGEQNVGEEYMYYPTISDDIKQEELSPTNACDYQFDNVMQQPMVPVSIQKTNGIKHSITDMQSVLQQHLMTTNPTQDISSLLQQADDLPSSIVSCNRNIPQNFDNAPGKGEQFPTIAESLSSNKNSCSNQQAGPLAQLLKTNMSSQPNGYAGKQKHESKKKSHRAKRQKLEAKVPSEDKIEYGAEAKPQILESNQPVKDEKQQAASQTVSQVWVFWQILVLAI